uniref:Uncharacterized protein n=1 Tax=Romanomermis culicivorax TaxID=13658 RepID=A0A915HFJ8_ROMCU
MLIAVWGPSDQFFLACAESMLTNFICLEREQIPLEQYICIIAMDFEIANDWRNVRELYSNNIMNVHFVFLLLSSLDRRFNVYASEIWGEILAFVDVNYDRFTDLIVKRDQLLVVYRSITEETDLKFTERSKFIEDPSYNNDFTTKGEILNVAAGDFNADSYPDLLVSTVKQDNNGNSRGAVDVTICWGSDKSLTCDFSNTYTFKQQPLILNCDDDTITDFMAVSLDGRILCYQGKKNPKILDPVIMSDLQNITLLNSAHAFVVLGQASWWNFPAHVSSSSEESGNGIDENLVVRSGDYTQNGFPDILVVLAGTKNKSQAQAFFIENVPCNLPSQISKNCTSFGRTFALSFTPLTPCAYVKTATFFDLGEDGTLDLLYECRNDTKPLDKFGYKAPPKYNIEFTNWNTDHDTTFLKVQTYTATCNYCPEEFGGIKTDLVSIGTAIPIPQFLKKKTDFRRELRRKAVTFGQKGQEHEKVHEILAKLNVYVSNQHQENGDQEIRIDYDAGRVGTNETELLE